MFYSSCARAEVGHRSKACDWEISSLNGENVSLEKSLFAVFICTGCLAPGGEHVQNVKL